MIDITGLREDKRPQSSTIVHALLDRLEAAEKERDALRAKIEAMEKQEPYSYIYEYANPIDGSPVWRDTPGYWNAQYPRSSKPLYALPGAQNVASVPNGWLRAIDEALVVAHIGVANPDDTYEQARKKLDSLIGFHTDVATDPAVNGGWKLVPLEPTPGMIDAAEYVDWGDADVRGSCINAWDRMLAAAPEAKP